MNKPQKSKAKVHTSAFGSKTKPQLYSLHYSLRLFLKRGILLIAQLYGKFRKYAFFALYMQLPLMLFDNNIIADGKPQAGITLTGRFGGVKGFEDPLPDSGCDAGTIIANANIKAGWNAGLPDHLGGNQNMPGVIGLMGFLFFSNGIASIIVQVEEYTAKCLREYLNQADLRIQVGFDLTAKTGIDGPISVIGQM